MTALVSHCCSPPSMHYLIIIFSYNNCAFLPRAAGGFPLFQGKAFRENAPFSTQRCLQPDAAGPRLSRNSQGRRPAKADLLKWAADLLGSSGLKRPQWRGQGYPAASFLSKCRVLPGWWTGPPWGCTGAAGGSHCCVPHPAQEPHTSAVFSKGRPSPNQSGLSLSATPSNTDFLYYMVKSHVLHERYMGHSFLVCFCHLATACSTGALSTHVT